MHVCYDGYQCTKNFLKGENSVSVYNRKTIKRTIFNEYQLPRMITYILETN